MKMKQNINTASILVGADKFILNMKTGRYLIVGLLLQENLAKVVWFKAMENFN